MIYTYHYYYCKLIQVHTHKAPQGLLRAPVHYFKIFDISIISLRKSKSMLD